MTEKSVGQIGLEAVLRKAIDRGDIGLYPFHEKDHDSNPEPSLYSMIKHYYRCHGCPNWSDLTEKLVDTLIETTAKEFAG